MPRYRSRQSPVPTIGFSIGGLFDNYDETKFLRHFGQQHNKGQQAFDESHQLHEVRATLTLYTTELQHPESLTIFKQAVQKEIISQNRAKMI